MNAPHSSNPLARGILYFCIGLAIGGVFYIIITSGWQGSLQQSRWLVQKQWATNEHQWIALDEIGRRLVLRQPRLPEGWDALITSALARGDKTRAQEILNFARRGLPKHENLWAKTQQAISQHNWQPPEKKPADELPVLGEPLVRATATLLDKPHRGCVTITFDRPVYSFLLMRAATYINQDTDRFVMARFPQPDSNPEVQKLQITFCPATPLATTSAYRFVFDMPQQRMGGAWMPYPLVMEIPPENSSLSHPENQSFCGPPARW